MTFNTKLAMLGSQMLQANKELERKARWANSLARQIEMINLMLRISGQRQKLK